MKRKSIETLAKKACQAVLDWQSKDNCDNKEYDALFDAVADLKKALSKADIITMKAAMVVEEFDKWLDNDLGWGGFEKADAAFYDLSEELEKKKVKP